MSILAEILKLGRKLNITYSEDLVSILRLIRSENIGPRTFWQLIKFFGSAKAALDNAAEFSRAGGNKKPITIYSITQAEEEINRLNKFGARLVSYKDDKYPPLLKHAEDAPPILTCFGKAELLTSPKIISVVGARNASAGAMRFAEIIAEQLAEHEIIVASGLARGIDRAAHHAKPSNTIAVLAGGVDHIYPPDNKKLYEDIAKEGLIIAELPIGMAPIGQHFPARNRIIAGISAATCIIEASENSGSLITAKYALSYHRDLFVMPGFPLDPRSKGGNSLLKNGAYVLETAQDIIDNVSFVEIMRSKSRQLTLEESHKKEEYFSLNLLADVTPKMRNNVLELLSDIPTSTSELLTKTQYSLHSLTIICLELELAGKICRLPRDRFTLKY